MSEPASDAEALSRFQVENEGQYGGGSELEHHLGDCDWHHSIDGMNPLEVLDLAREHAATCDGSRSVPAPRPAMSPEASTLSAAIAATWGAALTESLGRQSLLSAPGTDARDA